MLNHVVLMGRLTADPEIRYTPNNVAVASYTLAVERSYSSQGEQRKADFIDCTSWRQQAEFVSKYFRKGQLVAVEGPMRTDSYTDNQGAKRKKVFVVADRVHFAEGKKENTATAPSPAIPQQAVPPQGAAPAPHPGVTATGYPTIPVYGGPVGIDITSEDDIPF